MTNHPNRKSKSILDQAVGLILADERSGYSRADREGRQNIRRNVYSAMQCGPLGGTEDEIEASWTTADKLAAWYRGNEWRY